MREAVVRWMPDGVRPIEGDFENPSTTSSGGPLHMERFSEVRHAFARAKNDPVRDGMSAWVKCGERIYSPDEIGNGPDA
jgi:hypothetical protein